MNTPYEITVPEVSRATKLPVEYQIALIGCKSHLGGNFVLRVFLIFVLRKRLNCQLKVVNLLQTFSRQVATLQLQWQLQFCLWLDKLPRLSSSGECLALEKNRFEFDNRNLQWVLLLHANEHYSFSAWKTCDKRQEALISMEKYNSFAQRLCDEISRFPDKICRSLCSSNCNLCIDLPRVATPKCEVKLAAPQTWLSRGTVWPHFQMIYS